MKPFIKTCSFQYLMILIVLFLNFISATATSSVENLMVEYCKTPLGIDVKAPRFSWQMGSRSDERDCYQIAYQIIVKDPIGITIWDTKKVTDNSSVGIVYNGDPLKASTHYTWTVTVWNNSGKSAMSTSWFETGLLNPDPGLSAWNGATWIGGDDNDMVLFAHYLPIFKIRYKMTISDGSKKAAFVFGANDSRLMDKNKNIFQLQNAKNESYLKLELDISGLNDTESGKAKINVYRAGYSNKDSDRNPFKTFEVKSSVIDNENKNKEHTFEIIGNFGNISVSIDGNSSFSDDTGSVGGGQPGPFNGQVNRIISVNLNPMGSGHDYITYGMLCDIGFSVDAGNQATYSELEISNTRFPSNILFKENLTGSGYNGIYKSYATDSESGLIVSDGAYKLSGGIKGVFIVADPSHNAMPMLRTEFETGNKKIKDARLYVTARGIYEIYLNGKRVGEDYYNPGLTQYNVTHFYQTYDVTTMLLSGQNAMGAMLGEGWWSGLLSFGNIWNHFGDRQSLLAKLVITFEDGSTNIVTTNDTNWKYFNNGPITYSSLDMGEVYDATRENLINGWSTVAYNDKKWKRAVKVPLEGTAYIGSFKDFRGVTTDFNFDKMSLIGQVGNNAGIFKILTAKSVKEVRNGVYVYDMGQNIVGVPEITITNGKEGGKITLRYSEMLYPDLKESGNNVGMIMTENYRAALCQDIYIMKDGHQVFRPRFTSRGYQYIEITGIEGPLPLDAVKGIAISSIRELTAGYETSNEKVNKLWSNLVWSNVDNFLTIPTDCPQRNERMGWSGDISVFSRTATYVSNSDQFLKRHMMAMRDVQTASGKFTDIAPVGGGFGGLLWGSAGVTVPWEVYQQYNDVGLLEEHYNAMASYINYLQTTINEKTGLSSDGQLGDWLGPQNNQLGTPFLVTAYHIYDLNIMIKVAKIMKKDTDADKYVKMYNERKEFFNTTFVNADKKTICGADGKLADTQTSYAVGLALGAFNDENVPYMVKNLVETVKRENKDDDGINRPSYSLMTGFIGTAWICKALSDNGYSELAYRILQNNKYPSWLYAIDQGATTIWERLNGYTVENGFGGNNSMNSFNHYSFGAVGQWMVAYSLGIQRDESGFRRFILQPEPDPTGQMTWAKGYYDSMYGKIISGWKTDKNVLTYTVTVPANTTATLYLPASSEKAIRESGKPVKKSKGITFVRYESGKAVFELKSGCYSFVSQL